MGKSKETNTPYWVQIYQRSLKEVQEWFDLKKTIVRFVLIAVVLVVGLVRWGGVNFAFAQVQNLLLPELITIIVLILINPIVAVPHMFWVAAKRDSEQRKILSASEGPIENAISLDVDNDFRDNDGNQIVSIKVKNLMDDELVCYALRRVEKRVRIFPLSPTPVHCFLGAEDQIKVTKTFCLI
jgi:hypothetical protein